MFDLKNKSIFHKVILREFSMKLTNLPTDEGLPAKSMMKRFWVICLFCCLLALPLAGAAQLYAGVGLQLGFTNMPNANFPIDRYNDRAFLYKPMNQFHWPFGEIYAVSFRPGRLLLDLNLNTRRMRATAKSTDVSGIYQRDVRFVLQSISLGAGYAVVDQEGFALYLGGALDGGAMRLMTRTAQESQIARTPYYLWSRRSLMAGSAFAKCVFRDSREAVTVWSLTPYFQFPFQTFEFLALEQLLNQGYLQTYTSPLPGRPWNVGLAFNFDLELLGFLAN
jgi:hypothetical protein